MEFEIKDLEIIDHQSSTQNTSTHQKDTTPLIQSSLILKELHEENQELQNKLKLNQRRMLLFETENTKLLEEKNKFFFENQSYLEKNQILTEKNEDLARQCAELSGSQKLLMEKISSLENISRTQMSEIKRFTKFHAKIQDVVKPLLTKLKEQAKDLRTELSQSQNLNSHLNGLVHDLKNTAELEIAKRDQSIANMKIEKAGLVKAYEEQIHSFSKEILSLQSRNEEQDKEITRLKKVTEFKNYFENEVIRFKRTHEEDQTQIQDLAQKKAALEARVMSAEASVNETRAELAQLKTRFATTETTLDMAREQLSKKIDELNRCYERLSRLEKLNNQLSTEIVNVKQN